MKECTKNTLLVAGGFLLGTAGVDEENSKFAKKGYIQAVAASMRAKNSYDAIVEQAKAQVDDIGAEVFYLKKREDEEAEGQKAGNGLRGWTTGGRPGRSREPGARCPASLRSM